MRLANVRKLRYYAFSALCAVLIVIALTYAPRAWPYACIGVGVGVLLGFVYPLRRYERPTWLGTGLVLATAGGLVLSALVRALVHDQSAQMGVGAAIGGVLGAFMFIVVSRYLLRERSAQT